MGTRITYDAQGNRTGKSVAARHERRAMAMAITFLFMVAAWPLFTFGHLGALVSVPLEVLWLAVLAGAVLGIRRWKLARR